MAETKRIPRDWINSTPSALDALLDGYRCGDGSAYGQEGWWYGSSVSKGLIDDLQEVAFRCGIPTNTYLAKEANPESNRLAAWYIGVSSKGENSPEFGLATVEAQSIERRPYNGTVYCVTTESGIIATRRNGRVMWAGNSAKAMGYFLLDHLGQVERHVKSRSRNRLVNNPARRKYGAPSKK